MYLTLLNEMGFIDKWMDEALGNEYSYCDTKHEIVVSHSEGLEALNLSNISTVLALTLVGMVIAGAVFAGELMVNQVTMKSRKFKVYKEV